jgi:hypothetical protein
MPPYSFNPQELIERIAENRRKLPATADAENEALREQIAADTIRLAALQGQED